MKNFGEKMKKEDLDVLFPDERDKAKTKLDKLKAIELRLVKVFDYICKKHKIEYSIVFGTLLGAVRHSGFIPWDDDLDVIMTRKEYNKFLEHLDEIPKSIFFQTKDNDDIEWGRAFLAKLRDNNSRVESGEKYHSGAYLDIFFLDRLSSNKFVASIQKICLILMKIIYITEKRTGIFQDRKMPWKMILKMIVFMPRKIMRFLNLSNFLSDVYDNIFKNVGGDYCMHISLFRFLTMKEEDVSPFRLVPFEDIKLMRWNNAKKFLEHFYGDYMTLPPENQRVPKHFDMKKVKV